MKNVLIFALLAVAAANAATSVSVRGIYKCSEITSMKPDFVFGGKDAECGKPATDFADKQTYNLCKDGYNCDYTTNKCVADEVPTYAKRGDKCTSNSDCKFKSAWDGSYFSGTCTDSKCYYMRQNGEACESDDDCAYKSLGSKCTSGVCVAKAKTGEACTMSGECPATDACDSTSKKCTALVAVGGDCSTTSCVPGASCEDKKCVQGYSLADGAASASAWLCASNTLNSDGDKCAAIATTGSGTVATSGDCDAVGSCKQRTDTCLCTGNKKSTCVTTNPDFLANTKARNAKMAAYSKCRTTSGCSSSSSITDSSSCMNSKCASSYEAMMKPSASAMCEDSKASIASYYGSMPSDDDINAYASGRGQAAPCESGVATTTVAVAAVAVAAVARFLN